MESLGINALRSKVHQIETDAANANILVHVGPSMDLEVGGVSILCGAPVAQAPLKPCTPLVT